MVLNSFYLADDSSADKDKASTPIPSQYKRFEAKRQAALAKRKKRADVKNEILGIKDVLTDDILNGEDMPSSIPVTITCFFTPIKYEVEFR